MHQRAIVAHTVSTAVFLVLAGLVLAPYQHGTVTPFYGFVAAPVLLLGALAGAACLHRWLTSQPRRDTGARPQDSRGQRRTAVRASGWADRMRRGIPRGALHCGQSGGDGQRRGNARSHIERSAPDGQRDRIR